MADAHDSPGPPCPDLWSWSLASYARPGFSAAAIALQDQHRLDVNLLLYCLWAGLMVRVELGEPGLGAALATTGTWQRDVVMPLRAVRRSLKGQPPGGSDIAAALRQRVADAELEAERGEQALLAALPLPAAGAADNRLAAARNLCCYLALASIPPGEAVDELLARLLALAAETADAAAAGWLAAARDWRQGLAGG
jgi:uncharacterized protein (TIGR02444 family)